MKELSARFPDSFRVRRLQAMLTEAAGQYSQALTMYRVLLTEDKTDLLTMKRCVAIRREQGFLDEAIQQLIAVLKHFPADQESWLELADLYLSTQAYVTAAHCLEELMLISAENYHLYTRYAEIQHTMATPDSLRIALKYFCLSLELHSTGNLRAAYGGLMASHALATHKSAKKDVSATLQHLEFFRKLITTKYNDLESPYKALVTSALSQLAAAAAAGSQS